RGPRSRAREAGGPPGVRLVPAARHLAAHGRRAWARAGGLRAPPAGPHAIARPTCGFRLGACVCGGRRVRPLGRADEPGVLVRVGRESVGAVRRGVRGRALSRLGVPRRAAVPVRVPDPDCVDHDHPRLSPHRPAEARDRPGRRTRRRRRVRAGPAGLAGRPEALHRGERLTRCHPLLSWRCCERLLSLPSYRNPLSPEALIMPAPSLRGRFVWHELMTTDPDAAARFYPAVTGWKVQTWDQDPTYRLWTVGDVP